MKVIAIVNLPFDVDLDREDAFFVMRDGKYCQNVRLKPLPQKKGKHGELHEYDTDIHYEIGWNDCLNEILGETE